MFSSYKIDRIFRELDEHIARSENYSITNFEMLMYGINEEYITSTLSEEFFGGKIGFQYRTHKLKELGPMMDGIVLLIEDLDDEVKDSALRKIRLYLDIGDI